VRLLPPPNPHLLGSSSSSLPSADGPKSIEGGGAPRPPGADPVTSGSPVPHLHVASLSQEQCGLRARRGGSPPFGAKGGGGVTGEREAVGPVDDWDGERTQHP
jgi:hypothetical protein